MALASILDILAEWPGKASLDLSYGDETSGQGSGRVIVKELREPYWVLTAQTGLLDPRTLKRWKARLEALDNGKKLFFGYDLRHKYPASYPNGSWPTGGGFDGLSAHIKSVGGDGVSLALEDLPGGFALLEGDMLSFGYGAEAPQAIALHRAVEAATANGGGETPVFEVRPPLPFGAEAGDTVRVLWPRCHMTVKPGSISAPTDDLGWGTVSFQGEQAKTP